MVYSYRLIFLLLVLLLVPGCGREKITRGEYLDIRYDFMDMGKAECNSRGMQYLSTEVLDFDKAKVLCMTESPMKVYKFNIGGE